MKLKYTTESLPTLFVESGQDNEYELLDYLNVVNARSKFTVRHKTCGFVYNVTCSNFFSCKRGCANCAGNLSKYSISTIETIFLQHEKSKEYKLVDFSEVKSSHSKFIVEHLACGFVFAVDVISFFRGNGGCARCGGKERKYTQENFLNVWNSVSQNDEYELISYLNVENAHSKFTLKHKICNHIYNVSCHKFFNSKQRCPNCQRSKGEDKVAEILSRNNIDFIAQHTIKGCKKVALLRFDFFVKQFNILIEYQGEQHYRPNKQFGGESRFKKQQEYDEYKRVFAYENGYMLLEIPYWDYKNIEQILKTALNL